ncbi:MAG: YafY family transcriptional regulator [Anaerolineae bacterium]|nr:YafY family transcriptional regulator [Anaerolineae bacterium]NUQ06265.1 YafY family transcriptional regulator [Anaerolineae bacterium]
MYSPTTRLLTVLELLQSRGSISGIELAYKLEVDERSVRRYVTALRDMGIPVESEKGRYGAYSLRPGYRMPPLMFNDSETLAIALGLMAVRKLGLASAPGVESALAKIERVLPDELRERVRAIQGTLTLDLPVYESIAGEVIALLSLAAYQRWRARILYRGAGDTPRTEREVDCYGLVYHAGGWYAVCYCHLRRDRRTFRLDRIESVRLLDATFDPPEADFDPLEWALHSFANIPAMWTVDVLLHTDLDTARKRIPRQMAILSQAEGGVMMRCYANSLEWLARYLTNLWIDFTVIQPKQMRTALRKVARALNATARR